MVVVVVRDCTYTRDDVMLPYSADIAEAATLEELWVVWGQVRQAGHMTADVEVALRGRAQELQGYRYTVDVSDSELLEQLAALHAVDSLSRWQLRHLADVHAEMADRGLPFSSCEPGRDRCACNILRFTPAKLSPQMG